VERDERIVRGETIPLGAVDPVLLERAYRSDVVLFAEEWGLPQDGIPAGEIAVPLVYGVESGEWSEALGEGEGSRCATCGV
jgi:hypothetical protein